MVALTQAVGRVAAAHVVVQRLERQRHDKRAAVAMHYGFGQAGGAAGINNPQRVVKRQPDRLKSRCFSIISGRGLRETCAVSY